MAKRQDTYLFTSESVSEGHPDKICDQISDAVLDALLTENNNGDNVRCACETYVTTGLVIVGGELRTDAYIDLQELTRNVIKDIGYTRPEYRFDGDSCGVINVIHEQSADIAGGVDTGGAGDQGMMFGYACSETNELMPAPIMYSHKLVKKLADIRKNNIELMPYLRPDAKSQVTFEYTKEGEIIGVDTVVVSQQHDGDAKQGRIREDIINHVIKEIIPEEYLSEGTKYHINPTGSFVVGGPHGDAGLTGRKIIVDTYGGKAPHGGGAFSGKDATKVDRSAAYAARHLAKNIVAAGLTKECTIQLSYAIGVADPVSIFVNTHGNPNIDDIELAKYVRKSVDLTPRGIITRLGLTKPIFRATAAYGHFGRPEFPWEKLDMVDLFKKFSA